MGSDYSVIIINQPQHGGHSLPSPPQCPCSCPRRRNRRNPPPWRHPASPSSSKRSPVPNHVVCRLPCPFGRLCGTDPGLGGFLRSTGYDEPKVADNRGQTQGPTLRNVGQRPGKGFTKACMRNGVFRSLKEVVHFYNTRDVETWPAPKGNGQAGQNYSFNKAHQLINIHNEAMRNVLVLFHHISGSPGLL